MSNATTKLLTAEEFARLPNPIDGSKQELVRGEVETMPPPGFLHGKVQNNVSFAITAHARKTKSGQVTVESGVITDTGPDTVRGPDVAYWSYERLPADDVPVVYANVSPDLCVEILSPSNTPARTTRKVREYFKCGARMVWLVDPEARTVTVYRKPGDGHVLWEDATITGDDVLPGFTAPLTEFFQ
jgi:Uma2 family endonuclease